MNLAIIQARMGSSRLPGKILLPLNQHTVLWHVITRVSSASSVDKVIVATTDSIEDEPVLHLCESIFVPVFRGSEEDVLERFYSAACELEKEGLDIEYIVRITADCPLIDPEIIDFVLNSGIEGNYDYISNTNPPTFPDGEDVEVFSLSALKEAHSNATRRSEREHVTTYMRNNENFKRKNIEYHKDLSKMRWTLDQEEDYRFLQALIHHFPDNNPFPSLIEILEILNIHPEISVINTGIGRNEGYSLSLQSDDETEGMNDKEK